MTELEINFARLQEVHGHIERARHQLMVTKAVITASINGSLALPEFKHRIDELASLVDSYCSLLSSDSRKLYEIAVQFSSSDKELAHEYQTKIGPKVMAASLTER